MLRRSPLMLKDFFDADRRDFLRLFSPQLVGYFSDNYKQLITISQMPGFPNLFVDCLSNNLLEFPSAPGIFLDLWVVKQFIITLSNSIPLPFCIINHLAMLNTQKNTSETYFANRL